MVFGLSLYPETIDFFYYSKKKLKKFHAQCKECMKKKALEYTITNKESVYKYNRDYYQKNKEAAKEYAKLYKTREKELIVRNYKRWVSENKDKVQEYSYKRAMNKKHEISEKEWINCLHYFNYECAYCGITQNKSVELHGQKLHKEHVDHNGENDLSNNIPACRSCNSKKWTYDFEDWYSEENEVFSSERYEKIIRWLNGEYLDFIIQ